VFRRLFAFRAARGHELLERRAPVVCDRFAQLVAAEVEDVGGRVEPPLSEQSPPESEQRLTRRIQAGVVDVVGMRLLELHRGRDAREQLRELLALPPPLDPRERRGHRL
jgi:hypothetical protein